MPDRRQAQDGNTRQRPIDRLNPFRYFNSSPEIIRLAVMMYVRYPLSLRQVEDLLSERGIDVCHETYVDAPCSARRNLNNL